MYGKGPGEWGQVDGDTNATAIIQDRKAAKKSIGWSGAITGLCMFACFFWYGGSGSNWALSCLIVTAVWAVCSTITSEIFQLYTMLLITERRTQLLEYDMNALSEQLENAEYRLRTGHKT